MFTGLVEEVGTVFRCERRSDALVLQVQSKVVADGSLKLGDSIAINGVCLTATEVATGHFVVLAGAETLAKTSISSLRVRDSINLERAMALGTRLGGHLMQGHVDGVGTLRSRRDEGANLCLEVEVPKELSRYIIAKGSIALDGISLTVNQIQGNLASVALIPHTVEATAIGSKRAGQAINVEVDMIGKYVEKLLAGRLPEQGEHA